MKRPPLWPNGLSFGSTIGTQSADMSGYARTAELSAYVTKPEMDYTAKRVDALITEMGVMADKVTVMALQSDPTSAPSINDPALAEFKKSVLDEVKNLMAGGKAIPADVPWTNLLNAGSAASTPQAKVLNGVVYLRGEVVKSIGAGYIANAFQLPPAIPAPPKEMVIPLACKNTSPAGRHYGYATFQVNRQIGVSCDNALNTVWLDGISYPAYE